MDGLDRSLGLSRSARMLVLRPDWLDSVGPSTHPCSRRDPVPEPRPCPCHCLSSPFLSPPHSSSSSSPATKRGNAGRRKMCSYTSSSQPKWPKYGPLPMTACTKCNAPLKRKTCKSDKKGNQGRDYLKCLNEPLMVEGVVRSKFSRSRLL